MIIAYLIPNPQNPQFNIWNISHINSHVFFYFSTTQDDNKSLQTKAFHWFWKEPILVWMPLSFISRDVNLRRSKIWRSGIKLPHSPPWGKADETSSPSNLPPCPQIDLELPMFILTLQWEKRKKISKSSEGLPKLNQSWTGKIFKVHQSIQSSPKYSELSCYRRTPNKIFFTPLTHPPGSFLPWIHNCQFTSDNTSPVSSLQIIWLVTKAIHKLSKDSCSSKCAQTRFVWRFRQTKSGNGRTDNWECIFICWCWY